MPSVLNGSTNRIRRAKAGLVMLAGPVMPACRATLACWAMVIGVAAVVAGCATAPNGTAGSGVVRVVAAENIWGNLAEQLGRAHVRVISIIDNPSADPHDYEPTAADARAIATAQLVIVNGLGYDAWAGHLVEANPSPGRQVLTVGDLLGVPVGGNPHRWYNPDDVRAMVDRITAAYHTVDPAHAADYDRWHTDLVGGGLRGYLDLIRQIRASYAGTSVGASESIFAMLAPALGLRLLTPASFLDAISEGGDPTAADKATIDRQIHEHQIQVYVVNGQNATPDVQGQVDAARAAGIPVVTITETPVPVGASLQDWQVTQLTALRQALHQATGK